jgi:NAD(P)-dependent dehydrogenase (short-subunit alcohol dehydrogenase family)
LAGLRDAEDPQEWTYCFYETQPNSEPIRVPSAVVELSVSETTGDFAGRVALITGATRGLGRATAERLHERGANVAVNARDAERAEAAARGIGERAFAVAGDIAADGAAQSIVERTLQRFGRIDILVNNAALPLTTRFEQISAEEWRRAIE